MNTQSREREYTSALPVSTVRKVSRVALGSCEVVCVRSSVSETCEKKVPFRCFCFGKGF